MFLPTDTRPSQTPLRAMLLVAYASSDLSDDDLALLRRHYPPAYEIAAGMRSTEKRASLARAMATLRAAGGLQQRASALREIAAARAAQAEVGADTSDVTPPTVPADAVWLDENGDSVDGGRLLTDGDDDLRRRVLIASARGEFAADAAVRRALGSVGGFDVALGYDFDRASFSSIDDVAAGLRCVEVYLGGVLVVALTTSEYSRERFAGLLSRLRTPASSPRAALNRCAAALDREAAILADEADRLAGEQDRVVVAATETVFAEARRSVGERYAARARAAFKLAVDLRENVNKRGREWGASVVRDGYVLRANRRNGAVGRIERVRLLGLVRRALPPERLLEASVPGFFERLARLASTGEADLTQEALCPLGEFHGLTVTLAFRFDEQATFLGDVLSAVGEGGVERASARLHEALAMVEIRLGSGRQPCRVLAAEEFFQARVGDLIPVLEGECEAILGWWRQARGEAAVSAADAEAAAGRLATAIENGGDGETLRRIAEVRAAAGLEVGATANGSDRSGETLHSANDNGSDGEPIASGDGEAKAAPRTGLLVGLAADMVGLRVISVAGRLARHAGEVGAEARRAFAAADAKFLKLADKRARGALNALRRRPPPLWLEPIVVETVVGSETSLAVSVDWSRAPSDDNSTTDGDDGSR